MIFVGGSGPNGCYNNAKLKEVKNTIYKNNAILYHTHQSKNGGREMVTVLFHILSTKLVTYSVPESFH